MDKVRISKLILKICLWGAGSVVLFYLSLFSFLIFAPKLNSYVNQSEFDSTQWKLHLNDRDLIKQKMVGDLFDDYQLVGMTRTRIDQLLGVPPKTKYFQNYDYVYWLGPERNAFGIDSEWLGIKFKNGVVVKTDMLGD